MRYFIIFLIFTLFILIRINMGNGDERSEIRTLRIALGDEPPSFDISRATDAVSFTLSHALFEGLYRYHGGRYIPGMAEGEPEIDMDGKRWRFRMRKAFWNDGKPVTAGDFEYSWKRTLGPETGAKYAFILYDYIEGAKEFNEGKGDVENVAVRALDDRTLEVKLKRAVPFFKELTSFPAYFPLRRDVVEKHGRSYASSPDKLVFNGPFVLSKWKHDASVELRKNGRYWNRESVNIERIKAPIVRDQSTTVNMFETGMLDITGLSGNFAVIYTKMGKARTYSDGATFYLLLNLKKPIFKNRNIRKSLALAIDRKNFIKTIYRIPHIPAVNFVNPAIRGLKEPFREEFPGNYFSMFDPVESKKLLAKGLEEEHSDSLPVIELLIDDGETARRSAEFLQEGWRKILGLKIRISPVPFKVRLDRADRGEFDMVIAGWGPDYDDPMTFMDMWTKNSPFNEAGYFNQNYDEMIRRAKNSFKNRERMNLFSRAEKILMDDLPIIPLYHRVRVSVISPGVKGVYFGAFGPDPDWIFAEKTEKTK